jgi:hypothetical protein
MKYIKNAGINNANAIEVTKAEHLSTVTESTSAELREESLPPDIPPDEAADSRLGRELGIMTDTSTDSETNKTEESIRFNVWYHLQPTYATCNLHTSLHMCELAN